MNLDITKEIPYNIRTYNMSVEQPQTVTYRSHVANGLLRVQVTKAF